MKSEADSLETLFRSNDPADLRRALLALSRLEDPGDDPEEGGDDRDA